MKKILQKLFAPKSMENEISENKRRFATDYQYTDRETKAYYVWLKYQSILQGSILDVGADECHLKKHLPSDAKYWGIGLGGHPDQQINLEKEKMPFADKSYDCVLCLDVLEHLDNIHSVFDEICRVSSKYIIISLPNPWGDFLYMIQNGDYRPGQATKFYGLPLEPPDDRHKWFFSVSEAENFIQYRARKNGMNVLDFEVMGIDSQKTSWAGISRPAIVREETPPKNVLGQSIWAVLQRSGDVVE